MLFEFNLQIEYDIILLKNSVVKIKWKKNFYQSIFTYDIWEYSDGHHFKQNSLLVRSEVAGGQGFV